MNKFFYAKLAVNNIKRNAKTYIPYFLTCIGTIILFYNMFFLSVAKDIGSVSDSRNLRLILRMGVTIVGIFSAIFLFYTNSFLMKQRKKEFGLFNILGMEKKHIARVMLYETFMVGLFSIVTGLLSGILFSKLMILLLLKIIQFKASFGFEIPMQALVTTTIVFSGIFIFNLIHSYRQVHRAKPVELLKAPNMGEKEPKTKWVMTIIGVICLTAGYYIALTAQSPLAALNIFFFAVLLVIIGTYCLFTAGSIAMLKMLRKNKKYYYQANHFTSVSGMIYRMKQNAAGLANICILSTAVIVMLSTTFSLYIGMEDVLRTRYPRNIAVNSLNISKDQVQKLNEVIEAEVKQSGVSQENLVYYRYMNLMALKNGQEYVSDRQPAYNFNDIAYFLFITQEDYNRIENASVSLGDDEMLLYTLRGEIPGNSIRFNGLELTIRDRLAHFPAGGKLSAMLAQSYYAVVKDMEAIKRVYNALEGNEDMGEATYYYGFDTDADRDMQIKLVSQLREKVKQVVSEAFAEGAEYDRDSFYSLYGGLFFLGIFLGLLFIMATVLIIYYKQIAEGYDDRERFVIMQKVGMSHSEVKKSIHSQVLTVFFMPLGVAIVHLAFAFKVITKLLSIFNLNNIPLFAGCTALTILVFALLYTIVYSMTAKTYYRIVSA